jgi:hypothetical protein
MAAMRLILGATRPDKKIDGAANFRVYLKLGYQANRGMLEYAVNGGATLDQLAWRTNKSIFSDSLNSHKLLDVEAWNALAHGTEEI